MKRYRDISGDGGSGIVEQVTEAGSRLRARLGAIRWTVAIVSGKGGVGKSAMAANLASALALGGWRVGVLDADLNGPSIPKMLGVRGHRIPVVGDAVEPPRTALGISVMSMDLLLESDDAPVRWNAPAPADTFTWRGAMEANVVREFLADTAWGSLDALVLDLPPGTDRLATIASLVPGLAGIVVVTIPSDVAQLVVRKSITVASESGAPVLGLIENMAGLFPGPDAAVLARDAGIPFLGSVPFDAALAAAGDRGEPLVVGDPTRAAAIAVSAIAGRIRAALEGRS